MAAPKISNPPAMCKNIDEGRRAARAAARVKFGNGPLPINPATGKRFYGTGRKPKSGNMSPILLPNVEPPTVNLEGRFFNRRARAAALRERMALFSQVYNAAYLVRHSQHGSAQRREECVQRFVVTLIEQLRTCRDFEALLFAVADSLTADPSGVPWEG